MQQLLDGRHGEEPMVDPSDVLDMDLSEVIGLAALADQATPAYGKRSRGLINRMNDRKEITNLKEQLKEALAEKDMVRDHMHLVESIVPAARALGAKLRPQDTHGRQDTERQELVALHWTFKRDLKNDFYLPGVGLLTKSRAVVAKVVEDTQIVRFREVLGKCKAFRSTGQGKVVCMWAHEGDDTSNICRSRRANKRHLATSSTSKKEVSHTSSNRKKVVSQTVFVQRGEVFLSFVPNDGSAPRRLREHWACRPLLLDGKGSVFILKAFERGMGHKFLFSDPIIQEILESVDFFGMATTLDRAAPNKLALKYVGKQLEYFTTAMAMPPGADVDDQPAMPPGADVDDQPCLVPMQDKAMSPVAAVDDQPCMVHASHSSLKQMPEMLRLVSKLFSLAQLMKLSATQNDLEAGIRAIVTAELRRIPVRAPETAVQRTKELFDQLFKLDGEWWKTPTGQDTALIKEVKMVMGLINDGIAKGSWIHWCWDEEECKPCCDTREDSIDKVR